MPGQDLDDANNISIRSDWFYELTDISSLRVFGQYFEVDRNGSAIRGIDDTSGDARKLSQDTISNHELTSLVLGAIYENDLGFANLKVMASIQDDDISVTRDNDRHNFGDLVRVIPWDYSNQISEIMPIIISCYRNIIILNTRHNF